jgi:histone H3/H4
MSKIDYDLAEREYITTNISIRKLAEKYGMDGWSSMAEQARKRDWQEKRDEFRRSVSAKRLEKDVTKFVQDIEDLEYEQIQAARAIIFAGLQAIRDGSVTVQPRDITLAIDKLQLLTGKATERTEATVVGDSNPVSRGLDPEFLRRLEELSRGARNDAGGSAVIRIEGAKPN